MLGRTRLKPAQRTKRKNEQNERVTAQAVKPFIIGSCWWQFFFFFFCKLLNVIFQFDGGEQDKKRQSVGLISPRGAGSEVSVDEWNQKWYVTGDKKKR